MLLYPMSPRDRIRSYRSIEENCEAGVFKRVFGDEVKSVSVMEGHSVTLHTDVVKHKDDKIVWYYGPENTFVARINGKNISTIYSDDERLRDRPRLNYHTGDLTITHITSQHSGLYTLRISRNKKPLYKTFNLTVIAGLSVPVISRVSSQCSSSSSSSSCCCVLCSVMNVSHDVSVSWYKGKSLLSSISVSDLNIRLSLPLEVEYQDTNTYRCVVNNPITNLTQHLHITQLCHMSSVGVHSCGFTETVIRLVLSAVVGVATVAVLIYDIICK
ncbi:natural killer cell receptor 2B4-like isoform X3 [Triplophysa dalaica]|uniref:natural killer cell receptor 2B4-like isoform X3 n=1 Tax=Triplophysa dalaica TaxID=1582913 RepID=UPI0024DFF6C9|nr:natural killer cell receptor 2B4-like isoform X3 [Triplophysa dalaica]